MSKNALETQEVSLLEKQQAIKKFLNDNGLSINEAIVLLKHALNNNSYDYLENDAKKDTTEITKHKETDQQVEIYKESLKEALQKDTKVKNIRSNLPDIIELHDELRDSFREISPNFKIPYKDGTTSGNINKLISDGKTSEEVCILLYENYIKQLPDYFNTIHKTYSPGSRNSKDGAVPFNRLIESLSSILKKSQKEGEKISLFVESTIVPIINKAKDAKDALIAYHDTRFKI